MTFELTAEIILLTLSLLVLIILLIKAFKPSDKTSDIVLSSSEHIKQFTKEQLEFSRNLSLEQSSRMIEEKFQKIIKELSEGSENSLKNLHEFKASFSQKLTGDFEKLNQLIETRLDHISKRVQENLDEGFKKTNQTFTSVMERLTKIDEAQKNIEKLSSSVISLQDVLTDKKSRGIFGEVQLAHILSTVFGDSNEKVYKLQYSLPGGKIVDAMIFLPEPNGSLAVDSKFPLENYRRIIDAPRDSAQMKEAEREFKKNVKKHIDDIAAKYIIPGLTAEHAIMFLPAEAIFAEINAYHADLIDYAHKMKVAITSPTTFISLLTTIQVSLNNIERNKYTNIIHQELNRLGAEFSRYESRWNNLAKHMDTVGKDVREIHTTSEKISKTFTKIAQVDLASIDGQEKNTLT